VIVELVLLLALLAIGWAGYRAFRVVREVDRVPGMFREAQQQYTRIADHLEPAVDELNRCLFRYSTYRDRRDWQTFQSKSQDLRAWIHEQRASTSRSKFVLVRPVGATADVASLLDAIEREFDNYQAAAYRLTVDAAGPSETQATLARLEWVARSEEALDAIGGRARAHGEALQLFLGGSKDWFIWLRRTMWASLLALVGLGAWLGIMLYRRVVTPLHRQLIESRTIIERQQKLAHFGELAAGVAHEIRNPLTAISARLFTIQKSLAQGTTAHDDATVIREEIGRLNRIVRDFLELARPSEPRRVPLAAGTVLHEVRDLLAPEYEKQGIDLNLEAAVATPFQADRQQLKQVLINLVQNAAESMKDGGAIRLRARGDVRRLNGDKKDVVVIEVEDHGPGIPATVQRRLFDPFFSTKPGGTGLGLPIAGRIIEAHGGWIEFETEPGRGTTFCIILPTSGEVA